MQLPLGEEEGMPAWTGTHVVDGLLHQKHLDEKRILSMG